MKKGFILLLFIFCFTAMNAQTPEILLQKVKAKIDQVNDYEASGTMKTNVVFLKVPVANVKIYFKKPNKLKIKNEKGISFVPKGAVNINLNNVLSNGNYMTIDAGLEKINGNNLRVIKLLPNDENSDMVLSILYIDEQNLVIRKAKTTTRENGSYELEMSYGKYIQYALPDKIVFSFNTKDYKLPKGVTFDFDDGSESNKTSTAVKNKTGKAEIVFHQYSINKGVDDALLK